MEHPERLTDMPVSDRPDEGKTSASEREPASSPSEQEDAGAGAEGGEGVAVRDVDRAVAMAQAVGGAFEELREDPEFEEWMRRDYAEMAKDPEHQERVAQYRKAFMAVVRAHYRRDEGPTA